MRGDAAAYRCPVRAGRMCAATLPPIDVVFVPFRFRFASNSVSFRLVSFRFGNPVRFGFVFFQIENDRPEFKGDTMVSFVDGSPMTYYPPEVRSYFTFIPATYLVWYIYIYI